MRRVGVCLAAAMMLVAVAGAQDGLGKLDPSQPSGMTPEQIVTEMGKHETAFAKARDNYTFRQTVVMQTINDDNGKPDGEYRQVTDVGFSPDGKRNETVVFAPQNTLERVIIDESDFEDLRLRIPLVLTTEDLPSYDVKYVGKQRVDELDTYVFDATPLHADDVKHRFFQGRVWVDQKDLEIVMINGRNVPDDLKHGHFSIPFTTYYEQVDTVNWFPTYTRADGTVHFAAKGMQAASDIHMRNTVKYTDYRRYRSSARIIFNGQDITNESKPDKAPAKP